MKKAMIAMSGGVDSSVAAYLMKEQGYECIGATMHLYDNETAGIEREKTCCSLSDVEDARAVANKLDMPFYVLNFKREFKEKVIDHFICEYECGHTPNPCIDCNKHMKFEKFYHRAMELECDMVVTGHYARVCYDADRKRFVLKKGVDHTKDQSYVLYGMKQKEMAHTSFPLGAFTKEKAREMAEAQGFINARKRDSQDICFVPDGDYAAVIKRFSDKEYKPGDFIGPDGEVLGQHKGIIHYTLGQRRGLGLSLKEPLYVHHLDLEKNEVHLSRNDALFTDELDACDVNWIAYGQSVDENGDFIGEAPEDVADIMPKEIRCKAKTRYSQKEADAVAYPLPDGRVRIKFDEPVRAITKGQAVVMYEGDVVIGGGTIC